MPAQRKPPATVSPVPERLRPPSVQDRIVDMVVAMDLDPGDPLPPEPELMRTLGVSRNSVREALKGLQALGIVDVRHGYGTYVGTGALRSLAPGLLFHSRLGVRRENPRALLDIVEVRALLESGLIRRAARELSRADLDRLRDELEALAAGGDEGRAGHDRRFHELLYEPLGNELALQLIALFWDVYRQLEADMAKPRTDHEHVVRQHGQVLAALEARDPDAAAASIAEHFADISARIGQWAATRTTSPQT
ncbi:FadR/GntR family transcriptional regulator [Actinacidiphila acidipaludis]|uniref:FadR family transcriptional regulator n=1 Tax=Actinacidiphila acidipaludis TaxID=2873382 RepID=A0ABS7QI67_9ACTN|nr:FadR/GntR family transcriptional regulator [Streptomyces acidipaludis]MBY8881474.1 FadR family transcriptional regulator [Streptomyces acidipaludis]